VYQHCIYAEMLEKMEEMSDTVNVRNKTEKIIMPYYVVHNTTSNERYPLETGKHCCQFSALCERIECVVYR
jgi:hypothetical protein